MTLDSDATTRWKLKPEPWPPWSATCTGPHQTTRRPVWPVLGDDGVPTVSTDSTNRLVPVFAAVINTICLASNNVEMSLSDCPIDIFSDVSRNSQVKVQRVFYRVHQGCNRKGFQ